MDHRHINTKAVALCAGAGALLAGLFFAKPAAQAAATVAKQICFEAESGKITAPVQIYKDSQCSGGSSVEVPEGVNPKVKEGEAAPKLSGESTITFKVPANATYKLWLRTWWMDGCGNSFDVSVDGGRPATVTDGSYTKWHWVLGPKVTLAAGQHTIKIMNKEDGARCDQVFLTTDGDRIPVRTEKVTATLLVK